MRAPFSLLKPFVPPFALADLSPDFYFRGSYGGIPWLPTAPGNGHGNLTKQNAIAPIAGAVLNGFTSARMNFTAAQSQAFKAATAASTDCISVSAFTIVAMMQQFGLQPDQANFDQGEPWVAGDGSNQWGLAISQSGFRAGIFDPGVGRHQTTRLTTSFNATTIAAGSNGAVLPQGTINVASTAGADVPGRFCVATATGRVEIAYTGVTGTSFTGCTGGAGQVLLTGQAVVAMVWAVAVMRYDKITAKLRLIQPSGTANVSVASTFQLTGLAGNWPIIGEGGGNDLLCDMMEVALWKRQITDGESAQLPSYFNPRYLIGLT